MRGPAADRAHRSRVAGASPIRSAPGTDPIRERRQVEAIGRVIEEWGRALGGESRRPELPWRTTRDPWSILVSEVMSQQTQLGRVVPAYLRFMGRFPTLAACAASPVGDVLRAWQGLGYNRRARNLHRTAQAVMADHGGRFPRDLPGLLSLPGVGAYTAHAVQAFAFGMDVGVVDTNAGRVLSRAVAGRPVRPGEAQRLVDAMVPPGQGWAFGQALLDLGAGTCVAGVPRCAECPIRRRCRWAAGGRSGTDPAVGSAGVSVPQGRFAGSDRQGRGRLIEALRRGTVPAADVAAVVGWEDEPERLDRVVAGLVAEGMVVRTGSGALRLP